MNLAAQIRTFFLSAAVTLFTVFAVFAVFTVAEAINLQNDGARTNWSGLAGNMLFSQNQVECDDGGTVSYLSTGARSGYFLNRDEVIVEYKAQGEIGTQHLSQLDEEVSLIKAPTSLSNDPNIERPSNQRVVCVL